jgi:crotonobetainyl-CoA:carnitine CoA-transferase CaiB-like acyl-CoA transferase
MNQAIAGILAEKMAQEVDNFTLPLLPAGDFSSAMFAVISILAALLEVNRTGQGRYFDVSMTDGLVSWMGIHLTSPGDLGAVQPLAGYGLFKTGDGRFLALAVDHEQHLWRNLCLAIGRDDLGELSMDERTTRYAELTAVLKDVFLARGRDEWLKLLQKADVPAAPAYQSAAEVSGDPQLLFRRMIFTSSSGEKGNIRVGSPLPFEEAKNRPIQPAPELGANNDDILQSLGYSPVEIDQMKKSGVV